MSAVDPSISLGDLLKVSKEKDSKLPTSLAYLIFVSLVPSLMFLREQLRWTPNDIKGFNVLCKLTDENGLKLPECIFIDMGMAVNLSQQTDISDCVDLLQLVKDFADRTDLSTDTDWTAFKRMLDDNTEYALRVEIASALGKIWETWKDVAEEGRRKGNAEDKIVLKGLFGSAIMQKERERVGRVTDEDLMITINGRS